MKNLFIVIFSLTIITVNAQREDHTWYFSATNKGLFFDFNTNAVSVTSEHAPLSYEGCGVAADPLTGVVLFYSNGIKVCDKSHLTMPNGSNLFGNITSATNGIACPMPGQPNKYYLFCNSANSPNSGTIYYSIIDMNLSGNGTVSSPLGDIVSGQKNISLVSGSSEGFVTIPGGNNDYWLVMSQNNSNILKTFRITTTGISLFHTDTISFVIGDARTIKYSISNNKITIANMVECQGSFVADFNPFSGLISNFISIPGSILGTATNYWTGFYDSEWSPDGTKLYLSKYRMASGSGRIYQYDLNYPVNPVSLVYTFSGDNNNVVQGLQLAPDSKIYILYVNNTYSDSRLIGAISLPNIAGTGCTVIPNVLDMGASFPMTGIFPQFGVPYKYFPSNTNVIEENIINVYPNPTSDKLNICGFIGNEVSVIDALGNCLLKERNYGTINVSSLNNGIYFIQIKCNQKEYYSKFIIKR
ncbi:MAG: T9SS type A sorting domain-containing protein [Bacteroidia bacterium]|nr:T9SS type A sorting domain-containing protein [Bacteroidia bacterium]